MPLKYINYIDPFLRLELVSRHEKVQAYAMQLSADIFVDFI